MTGQAFKRCWQELSSLPLGASFTKSLFMEIPNLQGISETSFNTFFKIIESCGCIRNISGHIRGAEWEKVLDISWSDTNKKLKEIFADNYKKYGPYKKKKSVPLRTEPITPPVPPAPEPEHIPDDAMVVLPAEVYNQMKETIIHQDRTLKERDTEIEALKKNVSDKIDEVQQLQAELQGRKQLVRPDISFMKKIIPMTGIRKQI